MDNMERVVETLIATHHASHDAGPRQQRQIIDRNTGTAINAPTPSLHSAVVRHITGYGEMTAPYVKVAEEAFDTAHNAVQSVIDARKAVSINTAWHPDKQLLAIADLVEKKQTAATKAFDSARTRLIQGLTALDESLNKPLTQDANAGSINGEVRNHLKNLNSFKRAKLLDQALKDSDHVTLRAALSAPGYLSGLSETERQIRIRNYHVSTQPEIAKRADVMRHAVQLIETNGPLLFPQMELAMGGKDSHAKVAQARKRDHAARAALKAN